MTLLGRAIKRCEHRRQQLQRIHDLPENDRNAGSFGTMHNPDEILQRGGYWRAREGILFASATYLDIVKHVQEAFANAIQNPQDPDAKVDEEECFSDTEVCLKSLERVILGFIRGNYSHYVQADGSLNRSCQLTPTMWNSLFGDRKKATATFGIIGGVAAEVIAVQALYYYSSVGITVAKNLAKTAHVKITAGAKVKASGTAIMKSKGAVMSLKTALLLGSGKVIVLMAIAGGALAVISVAGGYLIYRYCSSTEALSVDNIPHRRDGMPGLGMSPKDLLAFLAVINALILGKTEAASDQKHYIILNVNKFFPRPPNELNNDEKTEILGNYKMLSRLFHPDKNLAESATEVQTMLRDAREFFFPPMDRE